VLYKGYEIRMQKHGLAELSSNPGQLKVFKGEALVELAAATGVNNRAVVKEGKALPFSAALLTEKFDDKVGDELYLWARDRSQVLSAANMSSARSLSSAAGYGYIPGYGFGTGGLGQGVGNWNGGWYFNPYMNMYTYVPLYGTLWSPFGYGFFSPGSIYGYYSPSTYWYGGGGPTGASAGGRPIGSGLGATTSKPVPIGQLLNSNTGRLTYTASPMRGGTEVGGQQGFNNPSSSAVSSSPQSTGGGSAPAADFGARGSGGSGGMSAGARGSSGGGHR